MIRYYQAELPARVKAFTTYKDGDYSIVVNAILSRKQQLAEIEHELKHINNGDHGAELHADLIEVKIRQNPPDQGGSSSFLV